jgi:hypothetical protein
MEKRMTTSQALFLRTLIMELIKIEQSRKMSLNFQVIARDIFFHNELNYTMKIISSSCRRGSLIGYQPFIFPSTVAPSLLAASPRTI